MTYTIGVCPCCGGAELESREALIAPFIATYVLDSAPSECRLLHCVSCDAIFFDQRFTAAEVKWLYEGYRGADYFAGRHAWEPWYTRAYNEQIGGDEEIKARKIIYRRAIAPWEGDGLGDVLDYGGDRGQLMPGGPGRRHALYDISGVDPVPNVKLIESEAELAERRFDLILLCHVIEHFSSPSRDIASVTKFLSPSGLLYVEVPFERFPFRDIPKGTWYAAYLAFLCRHPRALVLVDFLSTAIRVKFRRVPFFGFVKLHEHLTFFNISSLKRLLEFSEMEVLSCAVPPELSVVVAVCRRRGQKLTRHEGDVTQADYQTSSAMV